MTSTSIIPGGRTWLLLLICLFGYSVLNRGFAYIGYLPIFIGEVTLLFYLFRLRHSVLLPAFFKEPAAKRWFLFFAYSSLVFLATGFHDLRDAVQNSIIWVYTLFFYIGYTFGGRLWYSGETRRFEKFMLVVSQGVVLCGFFSPVLHAMRGATAFLYGGNYLVGNYSTYDAILTGAIAYFFYMKKVPYRSIWISMGLFANTFLLQSRAGAVGNGIVFLYMFFIDRKMSLVKSVQTIVLVLFSLVFVLSALNVSFQGKHGTVSVETVQDTIFSIFSNSHQGDLEGTKEDRLLWWSNVFRKVCSNPRKIVFGLGYSTILNTALGPDGQMDRYPHNSFISVLGYSGFLGLALFLLFLGTIFWKVFRVSRRTDVDILLKWYPAFTIGLCVSTCFSTVFEAPFHGFVFWSLSGIAYRLACEVSKHPKPPADLVPARSLNTQN